MKIFFQNEHFIAVYKEKMTLSVPSRDKEDARPILGLQLQDYLKQQIYPIHRLDFEVSGIMLFALTKDSHREGNKWFEDNLVHKCYHGTAENIPHNILPEEPQMWTSQLLRGKKRAYEAPFGKKSITKAIYIGNTGSNSKWQLYPITGRAHQLRYEMSKHGHPILGDIIYGAKTEQIGIDLEAVELDFCDVNSQEWGLPKKLNIPLPFPCPR